MRSSCASTTVVCWAVSIWKQWSGETQPVRRCSTAWPASSRNGLSGTRRWDGDFSGFNLISGILPEAKYLKSGQNLIFINRFLLFCGYNQVKNLIFINGFLLFCGYNQVKKLIFINGFLLFCGYNQVKTWKKKKLIFINGFPLFCGYNQVKTWKKNKKKNWSLSMDFPYFVATLILRVAGWDWVSLRVYMLNYLEKIIMTYLHFLSFLDLRWGSLLKTFVFVNWCVWIVFVNWCVYFFRVTTPSLMKCWSYTPSALIMCSVEWDHPWSKLGHNICKK